jgi:hypothetical protein
MRIAALVAAAVLVATPALAEGPRGEVFARTGSASFDSTSVRGPGVNMSRLEDGRWSGWLNGSFVTVTVDGNTVRGPNVSIGIERTEKELRVRGLLGQGTVAITIPHERKGAAWHNFRLTGTAASEDPPIPQMIFALIAAL